MRPINTVKGRQAATSIMGVLADKRRARWFYRFLSPLYDTINPFIWTADMLDRAIESFPIDDTDRVLDIGCGTGYATSALLEQTDDVHGLDQSQHQLGRARDKLGDRVTLYRGDAERLPFADDSFDAIWSSGSIEYWPSPQTALAEIRRVGRPGAPVIIVGPNEPSLWPFRKLANAIMWFYDAEQATKWCEAAGLDDIDHDTVGPWYNRSLAIITRARVPS